MLIILGSSAQTEQNEPA